MSAGSKAILRIVFYGGLIGAGLYFQPAVRCIYNPFHENNLTAACLRTANTIGISPEKRSDSLVNVALTAEAEGDFERAIELHKQADAILPARNLNRTVVTILNNTAAIARQKKSYPEAIALYTRALEIDPSDETARLRRGLIYEEDLHQYSDAIADYTEVTKRHPQAKTAYHYLAIVHKELDQVPEAIADWTSYLKLDPKNASAWRERAYLRMQSKDNGGAIADADQALALDPKEPYANRAKAQALSALAKFDEAIAVLDAWDNSEGKHTALSVEQRAEVSIKRGYIKTAMMLFDQAIELEPKKYAWFYAQRGWYRRWEVRDLDGALADFEMAIRLGDKPAVSYKDDLLKSLDKRTTMSGNALAR